MKKRFFAGVLAFCLALTILPVSVLASGTDAASPDEPAGAPNVDSFHSNADFRPFDPGYPEKDKYGDYILQVPELKGRLTFSADSQNRVTGTLFAPGVSRDKGWKNATKEWGHRDSSLCFAAASSNLIAWYLQRYKELNPQDTQDFETHEEQIFEHFRKGWDPNSGGESKEALSWYFTGKFPSGQDQPSNGAQLTGKEPGGYLFGKLPHNRGERLPWAMVSLDWDPKEEFEVFGAYRDHKFPFIEEVGGIYSNGPFSTLERFSKHILRQLHYGASILSIIPESVIAPSGHAITLWGADYDVKSGLVTRIYVTDSDDGVDVGLFPVNIIKNRDNDGFRMESYPYRPPFTTPPKFTLIRDSILMYAPDVVCDSQESPSDKVVIDTLHPSSDGSGVRIQAAGMSGQPLEYGYSFDQTPEGVLYWQSDSFFDALEPGQYYFFARVKGNTDYAAGGVSEPMSYLVEGPAPDNSGSGGGNNAPTPPDNSGSEGDSNAPALPDNNGSGGGSNTPAAPDNSTGGENGTAPAPDNSTDKNNGSTPAPDSNAHSKPAVSPGTGTSASKPVSTAKPGNAQSTAAPGPSQKEAAAATSANETSTAKKEPADEKAETAEPTQSPKPSQPPVTPAPTAQPAESIPAAESDASDKAVSSSGPSVWVLVLSVSAACAAGFLVFYVLNKKRTKGQ